MKSLKIYFFFVFCAFNVIFTDTQAQILADKTSLYSGDKALLSASFASPLTGDLYLAVNFNGELFFFSEQGAKVSRVSAPFLNNTAFSSKVNLIELSTSGIPEGTYPFFQVVTFPGKDPLDFHNWIGGLEGLSSLSITIAKPPSVVVPIPSTNTGTDNVDSACLPRSISLENLAAKKNSSEDSEKEGVGSESTSTSTSTSTSSTNSSATCTVTQTPSSSLVPTPVSINGKSLYYDTCTLCHGSNPAANQNSILKGKDYLKISSAIDKNKGGQMGYLKGRYTDAQLKAIAAFLKAF